MNKKGRLGKHLEKKDDNYSLGSREKLKAAMRHKIKRTFVGCLEALEHELAGGGPEDRAKFKKLRSRILSIGNDQIRNMEAELEKYNVEFIPYHIEFKVIERDLGDE